MNCKFHIKMLPTSQHKFYTRLQRGGGWGGGQSFFWSRCWGWNEEMAKGRVSQQKLLCSSPSGGANCLALADKESKRRRDEGVEDTNGLRSNVTSVLWDSFWKEESLYPPNKDITGSPNETGEYFQFFFLPFLWRSWRTGSVLMLFVPTETFR